MLVILQQNSANIKSVCSRIITKDSQPNNIHVRRRRFKTNSQVLYYRCTSHCELLILMNIPHTNPDSKFS